MLRKLLSMALITLLGSLAMAQSQGGQAPQAPRALVGDYRPTPQMVPQRVGEIIVRNPQSARELAEIRNLVSHGFQCEKVLSSAVRCAKWKPLTQVNPALQDKFKAQAKRNRQVVFLNGPQVVGTLINDSPLYKVWVFANGVSFNGQNYLRYFEQQAQNSIKISIYDNTQQSKKVAEFLKYGNQLGLYLSVIETVDNRHWFDYHAINVWSPISYR